MTPTERERIEKEAKEFANPWTPPNSNRRVAVDSYIAGANAEHDKARNQAIDDVINWIKSETKNEDYTQGDNYDKHSYGRVCAFNDVIEHLEQLKTKP